MWNEKKCKQVGSVRCYFVIKAKYVIYLIRSTMISILTFSTFSFLTFQLSLYPLKFKRIQLSIWMKSDVWEWSSTIHDRRKRREYLTWYWKHSKWILICALLIFWLLGLVLLLLLLLLPSFLTGPCQLNGSILLAPRCKFSRSQCAVWTETLAETLGFFATAVGRLSTPSFSVVILSMAKFAIEYTIDC